MEKKNHFCQNSKYFVAVLLKMILCLCVYIDTLNFTWYILANLTCPLKTYVIRLHNLIFSSPNKMRVFLYNYKEKAENK